MVAWILGILTWIVGVIIGLIGGAVVGYIITVLIYLLGRGLEEEYPRYPLVKSAIQIILYIGGALLLLAFGGYSFVVGYVFGCFSFMEGLFFDVKTRLKKEEV